MDCRVSVCIPTYNGEKYIRRQLETILTQLGENDEVIISDDSSTDETLSIIASFDDRRIQVLKGNTFKSPIFNLENALKHANGEYIFLADQDDIWLENKVADILPLLQKHEIIISDCTVVNANEEVIVPSFFKIANSGRGFWKNLCKNTYIGCCMAFRRSVKEIVLPFPKNIPMHDSWIALNIDYRGGSILFFDKPCILYRRHESNASSSSGKSHRSFFTQINDRWTLLTEVIKRSRPKCTK